MKRHTPLRADPEQVRAFQQRGRARAAENARERPRAPLSGAPSKPGRLPIGMAAAEVKAQLRRRHPATQRMGGRTIPGPWTCIEEWCAVDLLAICATRSPATGGPAGVCYPVVGYEVKVDRGDYRAELRRPEKREHARSMCHEFFFAVPRGLLRDDEMTGGGQQAQLPGDGPALWVPDDVGLVVVDGRGCKIVKPSPLVRDPAPLFGGGRGDGWGSGLPALIRWVSARPDPRHVADD